MRGAIAAGHRLTAEAGAEILAEGGNAVDACLAAAFVSWVAESPLTGPAAGGFLLVHRARDHSDRLLDFFVSVPGQGSKRPPKPHMESIDIDFDATSQVVYLIGAGSCAVPGAVAGLEAAHQRYGSLPWSRLLEPAIDLAREGVELTPQQAYLHAILDLILRHAPEGRAIYGESGRLRPGSESSWTIWPRRWRCSPRAAPGSSTVASSAASSFAFWPRTAASITRADLADYRVIWRRPSRVPYEQHEFVSNPPPSSGGVLIGYGLSLLDRLPADEGRAARPRSGRSSTSCASSYGREAEASRGTSIAAGSPGDSYADDNIRAALRRMEGGGGEPRGDRGRARNDADLGRRRARQRGIDDGVDRLRLGRHRSRHRDPHEQHAR